MAAIVVLGVSLPPARAQMLALRDVTPELRTQLSALPSAPGGGLLSASTITARSAPTEAGSSSNATAAKDTSGFHTRSDRVAINTEYLAAMLRAPEVKVEASGAIAGIHEVYVINLPGLDVRVAKTSATTTLDGHVLWKGVVVGGGSGDARFAISGSTVSALLNVDGRTIQIFSTGDGFYRVVELDEAKMPPMDSLDRRDQLPPPAARPDEGARPRARLERSAADAATPVTIDILLAYTTQAKAARPSIDADLVVYMDYLNTALANSNINLTVRAVGTTEVAYTEPESRALGDVLNDARGGRGDFARVWGLRNTLGADLITVFAGTPTDACGQAIAPDALDTNAAAASDESRALDGLSAVLITCGAHPFAHEVGHNLGANHDRYVVPAAKAGPEEYNFGYVDLVAKFREIMAYPSQCTATGVTCPLIPHFSNPAVQYNGVPTGIAFDQPTAADSARRISELAPHIARYSEVVVRPSFAIYALGGKVTSRTTSTTAECDNKVCNLSGVLGETMTLSAVPSPGYVFAGWSGDCAGRGECTVAELDGTVTANFKTYRTRSVFLASGARPRAITVGADNQIWYSDEATNAFVRLQPDGTRTVVPLTTAGAVSATHQIAAGPDGALWFTQPENNKIGRLDLSGSVTEFALPNANSRPFRIVAGPDGAMWFTESTGNRIGRISVSGAITEFAVPTSGSSPYGITAGPDGALWFTQSQGHKIGRITTAGQITQFPLQGNAGPRDIVSGPDGQLWFDQLNARRLGRMTTSGTITTVVTYQQGQTVGGLSLGPDRSVLVATALASTHYIWQITANADQTYTEVYHTIGPSSGSGLPQAVTGNDRAIWTAYPTESSIVRTVPQTLTARLGSVYSSASNVGLSFLRFYNAGFASGTVQVELFSADSGQSLGVWTSPAIAAGEAPQYSMATIEAALQLTQGPRSYVVSISPRINGTFQHVLWRPADGTLTNLSTCDTGASANAQVLTNVHSSILSSSYTSLVDVNNNGVAATAARLTLYDSRDGNRLATYSTPEIVSGGNQILEIGAIEVGANLAVDPNRYHYVIKAEPGFTGSLRHLVVNRQAGVTTDMTSVCVFTANSMAEIPVPFGGLGFQEVAVPLDNRPSPSQAVADSSGKLWFNSLSLLGSMTREGAFSTVLIGGFSSLKGIAAGPDSAIWYTDQNSVSSHAVGRMANGTRTTFALANRPGPHGIVAGDDGGIWFTQATANKIGRIAGNATDSSGVQNFDLTSAASEPWRIAPGNSGALWFTERAGNKIGRITTAGQITEFTIPTASSRPTALAKGPDGHIWFLQESANKIARITEAGQFTEWALPRRTSSGLDASIVAGADGAVWFVNPGSNRVGRISTEGAIAEFESYLEPFTPAIATAPDGALWVADRNKPFMGRLIPKRSGLHVSNAYSGSQPISESFLRFNNEGSSAASVTVTLRNPTTGLTLGTWLSPSVLPGTSRQFSLGEIEGVIPAGIRPSAYSLTIQSGMVGSFQHVLWHRRDGSITNLSACDDSRATNSQKLTGVHSSLLDFGYPSSVVVANTGLAGARASLSIFDATTGTKLGVYQSATIPANGSLTLSTATIERDIGYTPSLGALHYTVRLDPAFTGMLQHLVTNTSVGVVTDMTTACTIVP